jgi:hypothetical protein
MEEVGEASHRGCSRAADSEGEITPIYSERRRPMEPLGGDDRGRGTEYFAHGGDAMVAGDGRNGRATAEAIQIAREATGVRERGG